MEFTQALDNTIKSIDASGLTAGGFTGILGTGISTFKGGQGNDTITTAAITGKDIDAGAGDGDRIIVATATTADTAAEAGQYKNFEILRNAAASTQDVSLFSGITAVELGTSGAGVSKLTATQAANITNLVDNAGATISLADASGSSDSASIILKNATATASADLTNVSIAGVENLTVSSQSGSTGDVNALSFNAATNKLTNLTLTGDKSISVSLANVAPTTVTAAGMTGTAGLTISTGATQAATITGTGNADSFTANTVASGTAAYNGGAGNDTFNATAAQFGSGNSFAGGDGDGDTVAFSDTTVSASIADAAFQGYTGVEKLTFAATTGDVSVTTGGFFVSNFSSGVTVEANALDTGDFTFAAGTFTGPAKITTTATGDSDQTITTGSGADTISATTGTGGTVGAIVVSSGAGDDKISVSTTGTTAGDATVTGGMGKDTIDFAAAVANTGAANVIVVNVGAGDSTAAAYDVVSGFDLATAALRSSTLDFDGTATVAADFTGSSVSGYSSAELTATAANGIITFQGSAASSLTVDQRIAAVDSLINTDNATAAFVYSGNTYVFHDSASANGDSVVELVGVSAGSLTDDATTTAANALHIA